MRFRQFLAENTRPTIRGTGQDAARHHRQYIAPYIGHIEHTHTTAKDHVEDNRTLPAKSEVRILKHHNLDGKSHVQVEALGHHGHWNIPVSKLHKPGSIPENKGFNYENHLVARLHKAGIAKPETAGATGGNDFTLIHHKQNSTHPGQAHAPRYLSGEAKSGRTAAFGQITLRHTDEHGWHIPEKNRAQRPSYAKHIDSIRINGHTLYEHLNRTQHPDAKHEGRTTAPEVLLEHPNLHPAKSYLQDHHVDVVQIGGHGCYHVHDHDPTGHGLPALEGQGRWRIRQKHTNPRTRSVQFCVPKKDYLPKSHVDLDNDDHVQHFAKTLGRK